MRIAFAAPSADGYAQLVASRALASVYEGEGDTKNLLDVLHQLVEQGNTAVVIEHNLDVIRSADWVIDLGPEGGSRGGEVVDAGTPEDVAKNKKSHTGQWLAPLLTRPTDRIDAARRNAARPEVEEMSQLAL